MALTGLIVLVPPGVCACLHMHPSLQGPGSLPPHLHPPTLPGVAEVAEEPPSSGASPTRLWPGGVCSSGSGSGRVRGDPPQAGPVSSDPRLCLAGLAAWKR